MDCVNNILNWKLKRGAHISPGKDGGTCVNEAAIVAAGFPYQPVRCVDDMPECFSRPICSLAMELNDEANDEERQQLLAFVDRLACADTPKIERIRRRYIEAHKLWNLSFQEGLKLLDGALALGRQADTMAFEEVRARMATVQQCAKSAMSVDDPPPPVFAKLREWFTSISHSLICRIA